VTNDKRLAHLLERTQERTEAGAFRLFDGDGYIRVNADGFRAVCVSRERPLCEFGSRSVTSLATAVQSIKGPPRPPSKSAQSKRERCLQAHMIREALRNGGDLLPMLPGLPFDRLLFALDEVPLNMDEASSATKTIRCDLLAVGIRGRRSEPVIIELKWGRALTRLVEQLQGYARMITTYRREFGQLLGEAIEKPRFVKADRIHGVIVWPPPPAPRQGAKKPVFASKTADHLRKHRISAIQFEDSSGYEFKPEVISQEPAWVAET
jgi:hypothetical protein